ncbi:MAG TPA: 3-isopropylmalate dehydratase small subunit [Elusimicrobiota bacterium]|nr:3-isopropylmalate dehydratase small subunit [Elusimicrobiota bacterium]
MKTNFRGKAHKFGDDVDTDFIVPARYLVTTDPVELGKHCMEGQDPQFVGRVRAGDIMVAGKNFGCGSSREHAPWSIQGAGLSCVVAKSFARIFFRNSINIGLPILESPEASEKIQDGDDVEVDLTTGVIKNHTRGETYSSRPFPEFMRRIVESGGLMKYVRKKLALPGK